MFGLNIGPVLMVNAGQVPPGKTPEEMATQMMPHADIFERKLPLRLERFLNQKVLCFEGVWITREDAIKNIANFGSGVHTASPKTKNDEHIVRLRTEVFYGPAKSGVDISMFSSDPVWAAAPIGARTNDESQTVDLGLPPVDAVLLEVLIAVQCVAELPSVIELEEIIRAELGAG